MVQADYISEVCNLSGVHTRIAWCADIGGARGSQIWGFDTDDGKGERVIVKGGKYDLVKFSKDGKYLAIANHKNGNEVWVVNWDGSGYKKICNGQMTDLWRDPDTGKDWVFYTPGTGYEGNRTTSGPLRKAELNNPANNSIVYNGQIQGRWFTVSADGKYGGGNFGGSWGGGIITLATGVALKCASGPWIGMAPDNSYGLISYCCGDDGFATYKTFCSGRRYVYPYMGIPGFTEKKIGHITWSNHARFVTTEAQGTNWTGRNNDTVYGHVYFGKLSQDLSKAEKWIKVTTGGTRWAYRYFRYGHAWIEGNTTSLGDPVREKRTQVVFPNPVKVNERLSVTGPQGQPVINVKLYDQAGIEIPDLRPHKAGVYLLKIKLSTGETLQKVMVY
jgi:hypothetical protein